jgi:hypothetical protein
MEVGARGNINLPAIRPPLYEIVRRHKMVTLQNFYKLLDIFLRHSVVPVLQKNSLQL